MECKSQTADTSWNCLQLAVCFSVYRNGRDGLKMNKHEWALGKFLWDLSAAFERKFNFKWKYFKESSINQSSFVFSATNYASASIGKLFDAINREIKGAVGSALLGWHFCHLSIYPAWVLRHSTACQPSNNAHLLCGIICDFLFEFAGTLIVKQTLGSVWNC